MTALSRLRRGVRELSPAYFAMAMATGIVSIAAHLLERPSIAAALFALNVAAYLLLWLLTALRLWWFPRELARDLADHSRGPGFFTAVAASGVLGSQFALMSPHPGVTRALWMLALVLWGALIYGVFATLTIKERKPTLEHGISGGWLLAVVATQSVAVLSAQLAAHSEPAARLELNFLALSMWLWGGMLYIWMISLIFYRYTFFRFHPQDLSPPYWISMGAMAISTLAGSLLIANAPHAWFLTSLLPFLKGFTLFYWATGTWWIPMMLVLGAWRYVWKRLPLRYDPLYWGGVFPVGMYAASTFSMARAMQLPFLDFVPQVAFWIALAAWAAAFAGLLRAIATALLRPSG